MRSSIVSEARIQSGVQFEFEDIVITASATERMSASNVEFVKPELMAREWVEL